MTSTYGGERRQYLLCRDPITDQDRLARIKEVQRNCQVRQNPKDQAVGSSIVMGPVVDECATEEQWPPKRGRRVIFIFEPKIPNFNRWELIQGRRLNQRRQRTGLVKANSATTCSSLQPVTFRPKPVP
jgi:hypothetical protein